ncbi:MAG: DUF4244 domain-containing protein [Acidobacteria bacterium]|nr:DUF4244 domain-containing protein [Acidobacteriota bacterium]
MFGFVVSMYMAVLNRVETFDDDSGQSTAEYALLLLGAAALALLVLAWATKTGKVTTMLNRVFDSVIGQVT